MNENTTMNYESAKEFNERGRDIQFEKMLSEFSKRFYEEAKKVFENKKASN